MLTKIFITVAHLILLVWMLGVLSQSGEWQTSYTMMHFMGMGLYGFALIFGTARWARRQHLIELANPQK
jgi:hypothetical protein